MTTPRLDRIRASEAKQNAVAYRRQAHHYLRTGHMRGFHQFMHDALRAWDNFKYYSKRAAQ